MPTISLHGIHYHYEWLGSADSSGAGSLPPIVALHGFTGRGADFRSLAAAMPQFRWLVFDLLGHGSSTVDAEPVRYSLPSMASDLSEATAALIQGSFILYGYSMGGRVALTWVVQHPQAPISALILESSTAGIADSAQRAARRRKDEGLAGEVEAESIEEFVNYWENIPLFASQHQLPSSVQQQIRRSRLTQTPHGLASSLRYSGTGIQASLWDDLPGLSVPLLYLNGAEDKKYHEIGRRLCAAVAGATFVSVPGRGHNVHVEDPGAVAQVVSPWIDQHVAQPQDLVMGRGAQIDEGERRADSQEVGGGQEVGEEQ
ncbi:MAG: 2-succinyl-6-hydroxy-2,4-cyclohexadiene-1-carboxylate synthase [Actinomycetaceae bacterium]|nr:2-succinyl-6-hydroxy-2,4-cyclohexadiene-1-carboxylate synthase [Actinomycetaceae bacterium]MDY6082796.1 2-succinyl-6-hydroxy-2,4-cyclohexadiene-1-carboxylate synthase [Actinomycetaceae bacterium]